MQHQPKATAMGDAVDVFQTTARPSTASEVAATIDINVSARP